MTTEVSEEKPEAPRYRFIGAAEPLAPDRIGSDLPPQGKSAGVPQAGVGIDPRREVGQMWHDGLREWGAGTLGGGIAGLLGELHFGRATQVALGGIEGLLFGSCVVGALALMGHFEKEGSSLWRL